MALSDEQKQERRKHIGSSDAAAILGKDPWRTSADVYVSKVEELDDRPNPAMLAGTKLERPVLEWAADELGKVLLPDQFRVSQKNEIMAANHDALVKECADEGVEAKTACILHYSPAIANQWGEPGSDQVPDHVLIQVQHQMFVSDLQLVWVPCLIGGRGFQMYRVERNDRLIDAIVSEATRFWNEHVIPRIAPNGHSPSLDVVKSVRRQPKKIVPVRAESVVAWQEAKEQLKQAEDVCNKALATVLGELGDAEAGECELGRFTYFEQTRKEYVAKASTYRVPRFQKVKV